MSGASFYLSDEEIADLCRPLTQPAAQVRFLRALGLTVQLKPNRRPIVVRSHAEAVLGGDVRTIAPPEAPTAEQQPNVEAFRARVAAMRRA